MKKNIIITWSFCLLTLASLAQDFKLPAYQKFVLKNGLTVYLAQQKEVPVISANIILPAGAIYDGANAGLASFTATALKHGTKNYTKAKFDESLDFLGAFIATGSAKEFATINTKFAAKDKVKVFGMLQELLLEPTFDATEFEKEKKRALSNLEQQKESPRSLMPAYLDKFMYGNHVYGNIVQGTKATISALQVDDVKRFYKANYVPNGSAIAIAGDFDIAEMKAMVTKLFSSWKNGAGKTTALAPVDFPTTDRVLLINRSESRETTFYIAAKGVKRDNPDFVAIDVINTLFGGRFTSMLNDELRVNSGLTYGASSRFSSLKNAGTFYISTFTANKTTAPAIQKALEVLKKLHSENGIDENALSSAKNYVKGQFPPRYETAAQLSSLLTQMFWYGFDERFINNFQKNVDELTLPKAKEIIAKYFPQDKLQFIVIGKAEEIKPLLGAYGEITELEINDEIK